MKYKIMTLVVLLTALMLIFFFDAAAYGPIDDYSHAKPTLTSRPMYTPTGMPEPTQDKYPVPEM